MYACLKHARGDTAWNVYNRKPRVVNLTLRRFRLVIGDVFGTSEILDETEPLISSFLISTASPDPSPWKTGLRSKQLYRRNAPNTNMTTS